MIKLDWMGKKNIYIYININNNLHIYSIYYYHPLRHTNPPQGIKNVNYIFGILKGGVHAPCCTELGGELKKIKWWCTRCFTIFAFREELTCSDMSISSIIIFSSPPTPSKKVKYCIRLPAPRFYFLAPPSWSNHACNLSGSPANASHSLHTSSGPLSKKLRKAPTSKVEISKEIALVGNICQCKQGLQVFLRLAPWLAQFSEGPI